MRLVKGVYIPTVLLIAGVVGETRSRSGNRVLGIRIRARVTTVLVVRS